MKRTRIDLRVSHAEKEAWEAAAKQRGLKLSELIRRAVNKDLIVRNWANP